jgi:hypothetical protein
VLLLEVERWGRTMYRTAHLPQAGRAALDNLLEISARHADASSPSSRRRNVLAAAR